MSPGRDRMRFEVHSWFRYRFAELLEGGLPNFSHSKIAEARTP
ncbi:hypothetical protein ACPOL_3503 [Acidisarcina polymorpha]|uniref:Uncharacterized protein n=1 Tax=Acidisarcina polymorpha TaxID=2211140 RepID=A0A2Z5G0X7_9BACT|nr:hypothetical protein ACPOL_3503 [Acidisarcina polymorpha]